MRPAAQTARRRCSVLYIAPLFLQLLRQNSVQLSEPSGIQVCTWNDCGMLRLRLQRSISDGNGVIESFIGRGRRCWALQQGGAQHVRPMTSGTACSTRDIRACSHNESKHDTDARRSHGIACAERIDGTGCMLQAPAHRPGLEGIQAPPLWACPARQSAVHERPCYVHF